MTPTLADDPVLIRFKAALQDLYGDRIDRVILFGSRARGDARRDSDYDVAVFLKSRPNMAEERRRLADLRVDLIDETDMFSIPRRLPLKPGTTARR